MIDDKESDIRNQRGKNYEDIWTDDIEVLKLETLIYKRYIYKIEQESDERNRINMIDDKESDERDQIVENREDRLTNDI